jgi:ABC-type nitrate/sulfonate/bicarbonate transport system substrate-binding protein
MMRTIVRIAILLLVLGSLITACTPQEVEQPPDDVTAQLKWTHQAQFAGFYAAEQKGFNAEAGLDVTLLPGKNLALDTVVDDLLKCKKDLTNE